MWLIKHQMVLMVVSFRSDWLLSHGSLASAYLTGKHTCVLEIYLLPPRSKCCFKLEIENDSDCEFGSCECL